MLSILEKFSTNVANMNEMVADHERKFILKLLCSLFSCYIRRFIIQSNHSTKDIHIHINFEKYLSYSYIKTKKLLSLSINIYRYKIILKEREREKNK